jgi:hypothetical protein
MAAVALLTVEEKDKSLTARLVEGGAAPAAPK